MSGRGLRAWIAAGGALLVCAGCGFKGPLYLPQRNATVVTHPAQPQAQAARRKGKAVPAAAPRSSPAPPPP